MFRLSCRLIALACVLCFLFASPQAYACSGPGLAKDSIFFNVNDQALFVDNLDQKPPDAQGLVKLPPDADVIAEVFLTDIKETSALTASATANIVRVIKTSDPRVREGEKFALNYMITVCEPNYRNGDKGIIAAKIVGGPEGPLILRPYSRRLSDGRISSPFESKF